MNFAHRIVLHRDNGDTFYPNDGIDEGILLKNADIAMFQAKQAGRARYQLWKKA
jgi:GGDEF domain-containing protein